MSAAVSSSTPIIARIFAKAPHFFGTLLLLTAALLVWHHYGMERVYELSARSGHKVEPITDSEQGGASTATLSREDGALHLKCNLVKKAEWPYCKFLFTLGEGTNGVDLSDYDYLTVDASYRGEGVRQLRLTIIDFEHGLSVENDWRTHKMVELDAFDLPASGRITLPTSLFQTATWWKDIARLPVLRTNARVDNARNFLVWTGPHNTLGEQDIVLRNVRFHGKRISLAQLLGILVTSWIVCAIAWQGFMMFMYKNELNDRKVEIALLADLNRALKLETRELVDQVHTDPLTGVLNRQGLRSLLMHSSSFMAPPMSIAFLDIDHFKKVNDQHGHQVGDRVLHQFAATITTAIRSTDRLVRWGGEEFLLLCPTTDAARATALAEKLRARIESSNWPNGLYLTSSFGVAQHTAGEDIGLLIERADAALYSAKAAGRNRVHTFGA